MKQEPTRTRREPRWRNPRAFRPGRTSKPAVPADRPDGSRFTLGTAGRTYQDRYWHEREFATVGVLRQLADRAGVSLVTLAVAWVMANPAVTAPIIGASRPDQLGASLAAAGYQLDAGLKRQLDEVTHEYRMGDAPR